MIPKREQERQLLSCACKWAYLQQRATEYGCIADIFHGCNLTTEDWGGGPQPISMAVMFPFVCSVLSPDNSCVLEGKENINQGFRNAPGGHSTCLLLCPEGTCCSTLWFIPF